MSDIKYITDFLCTYQHIEDLEESDIMYKIQYLQAFDLWDERQTTDYITERCNFITKELYEKYKNNEHIVKILENDVLNQSKYFKDKLTQFRGFFAYNSFYLFHNLLINLINNNNIDVKKYHNLFFHNN
jgi:hypothetical protein